MRIGLATIIAVVAVHVLAGCTTPYQRVGYTGGFRETQLAPDVYRVSFIGNGYTSTDRVQDFALLRAAELTLANNARYFVVVSSADQTRVDARAEVTYYKPGVGMMIRTLQEKPSDGMVFDAAFVASSIRAKYGMK